jgi:hypothetical protein
MSQDGQSQNFTAACVIFNKSDPTALLWILMLFAIFSSMFQKQQIHFRPDVMIILIVHVG